jgi:hypothetical protein
MRLLKTASCLPLLCLTMHAFASPPTVYGIQLGAPPAFSECEKRQYGAYWAYAAPTSLCLQAPQASAGNLDLSRTVMIAFPFSQRPANASGSTIGAVLVDGNVEALVISTLGYQFQDNILSDLTTKFGTPTSSQTLGASNGFGAKFQIVLATWDQGDDLQATFLGQVPGAPNSGEIVIGTRKGVATRDARLKQATSGRTPM